MPARSIFSVAVVVLFIGQNASTAEPVQWTIAEGGNGHWYEAVPVPEGITWDDANAAASASGTHLATITSAEENAFVFGLISDSPEFWVVAGTVYWGPWLGGSDEVTEGTWEWITGEPWVYENWGTGQPDDSGGQDHLHFRGEPAPASEWDDFHRDAPSVAYITETPEIPIPTVSEWGLVAMTLLVLATGTLVWARRRSIRA